MRTFAIFIALCAFFIVTYSAPDSKQVNEEQNLNDILNLISNEKQRDDEAEKNIEEAVRELLAQEQDDDKEVNEVRTQDDDELALMKENDEDDSDILALLQQEDDDGVLEDALEQDDDEDHANVMHEDNKKAEAQWGRFFRRVRRVARRFGRSKWGRRLVRGGRWLYRKACQKAAAEMQESDAEDEKAGREFFNKVMKRLSNHNSQTAQVQWGRFFRRVRRVVRRVGRVYRRHRRTIRCVGKYGGLIGK